MNSYIYGDLLAPQLARYSQDPPSTDYQSLVLADDVSQIPVLSTTGNAALDAILAKSVSDSAQSVAFLKAVNDSFDRYSGALAASDGNSAGLQLEAMLYYLQRYDETTQTASTDMRGIVGQLPAMGIVDLAYDPNKVRSLQQMAAGGLPADLVQTFLAAGLTADQIEAARQRFLQFDADSVSGTFFSNLSQIAVELSRVTSAPITSVSVNATIPVAHWNGPNGAFTVQRVGDSSTDLVVHYTVKGTGIGGADYQLLKGSKKIKAGKDSVQIKVKPLGTRAAGSKATVKMTLLPDPAYTVDTPDKAKVKIVADN